MAVPAAQCQARGSMARSPPHRDPRPCPPNPVLLECKLGELSPVASASQDHASSRQTGPIPLQKLALVFPDLINTKQILTSLQTENPSHESTALLHLWATSGVCSAAAPLCIITPLNIAWESTGDSTRSCKGDQPQNTGSLKPHITNLCAAFLRFVPVYIVVSVLVSQARQSRLVDCFNALCAPPVSDPSAARSRTCYVLQPRPAVCDIQYHTTHTVPNLSVAVRSRYLPITAPI